MGDSGCRRRVRPLYDWEIAEAHKVFGDSLHYDRVCIHECATWTDAIDRLGRRLKKLPPLGPREHNAVTLGYHCHFPVNLPDRLVPPDDPLDYFMPWLIHELTHAWQFQHIGWSYLFQALSAQLRLRDKVYDLDPPDVMVQKRSAGWTLSRYNMEQQATLVAAYYYFQRSPQNNETLIAAYGPYVGDLGRAA